MTLREIRYQGAVVDGSRLLLLYCIPRDHDGFWVLPGGGREPGESEVACVARELYEEAGIIVVVGPLLYDIPAEPPEGTYARWRTYRCAITTGAPAPGGGEGWADLTAVQWLPLDQPDEWAKALHDDPFLHPQLRRIAAAVAAGSLRSASDAVSRE